MIHPKIPRASYGVLGTATDSNRTGLGGVQPRDLAKYALSASVGEEQERIDAG